MARKRVQQAQENPTIQTYNITVGNPENPVQVETLEDGRLQITVDPRRSVGPSSSGKSVVVATTGGNIALPGGLKLGMNLFFPNAQKSE